MLGCDSRGFGMRVYIGHDRREEAAFGVAFRTAQRYGCEVTGLYEDRLRMAGMLTRPTDRRGHQWDFNSSANQSTDFAISRFFVPLIAHAGWCLFVDCDVVFMANPRVLLALADPEKAVMVVKHRMAIESGAKMDGQQQDPYPRKNWSSVCLWNCDHPANKRLNLTTLNQWPGRDLHAFGWLADSEIGDLPAEANWLVGIQPKPTRPIVAHFTLGTPDIVESEHADIWRKELQ